MNLLKRLINLWAGPSEATNPHDIPPTKVHVEMPPAAPPKEDPAPDHHGMPKIIKSPTEPSCLAKGVAKAWADDRANWVVKRTEKTPVTDEILGYPTYGSWDVTLSHRGLDIKIAMVEHGYGCFSSFSCSAAGRSIAYPYRQGESCHTIYCGFDQYDIDERYLSDAIKHNPYPALADNQAKEKVRSDQRAVQDAARAAKIKAIEALGCAEGKA